MNQKTSAAAAAAGLCLMLIMFNSKSYARDRSEISLEGNTVVIEGDAKLITSPGTFDTYRIDYKVRAKGKMLFADREIGGTMLACMTNPQPTKADLPKKLFRPITIGNKSIGWLVEGGGICGNTYSSKYQIILPGTDSSGKIREVYALKEIVAKTVPAFRTGETGVELWYLYQEWAGNGTASSFFVPRRLILENGRFPSIASAPIGVVPEASWPKFKEFEYDYYQPLFVAAILDRDPALMKLVADKHFASDAESLSRYKELGLPTDRAELRKMTEALITLQQSFKNFKDRQ